MFKQMKLSTKLGIAFLMVGVLPAAAISGISIWKASVSLSKQAFSQLESVRGIKKDQMERFFAEREGDMSVLVDTIGTLRAESMAKLSALRETKAQSVRRYLQTIHDQMLTFAEERTVVEATRDLPQAFRRFGADNETTDTDLERMRVELKTYYTGEFSEEYQNQNPGTSPPVEDIFAKLDASVVAIQHQYIRANEHPLGSKHLLDAANDKSDYSRLHAKLHPIIRNYLEKFGYYDIFLADIETGDIFYSVFKELDFATSLKTGPYAQTNFGEAFRKAATAKKGEVVFVDYARYMPSYEAPAGFVATPVFDGEKRIGVAMFQFPIETLNTIMTERTGLGESGETYLVGADKLMRSDSFLDPKNHTVAASFRNPAKGSVDTEALRRAVAGESGTDVIIDYNGNPVLSAFTPIEFEGLNWVLLAEIDVAEAFSPVDDEGKEYYAKYIEKYGYYDLFLMNPDGYVFYTVTHESDYQTNMLDGEYADSGLGKLTRQVLQAHEYSVADFEPYAPSNGDPAAFIAQPVQHGGEVELVVALQISLDAINSIMQQRDGMGETGETYLVGQDKRMRSNSYLDPKGHSVKASFAGSVADNGVDTEGASAAIAGETGSKIIIDYNGNPVLSAYTPVKVGDTTWALLAEIDEAEAFAAIKELQVLMGIVVVIGIAAILAAAWLIARSITRPIAGAVAVSEQIAQGDLSAEIEVNSKDETGQLLQAMKTMNGRLREIVGNARDSTNTVVQASAEIAQGSTDLSQRTEEQASSLEETAASLEEMTGNVKQNADSADKANQLAKATREQAEHGGEVVGGVVESMASISEASNKIADIIGVIDEIAFQTNLLALNAAVEAARAGEQGRGFAVVAGEVRNLAQRSAEAAKEIKGLITDSVEKVAGGSKLVDESGASLQAIVESVKKVSEFVAEIAAASRDQATGIDEVNRAVTQMDEATQQNAALVEETAAACMAMQQQSRSLKEQMAFFKLDQNDTDTSPSSPTGKVHGTEAANDRRRGSRPWTQPGPQRKIDENVPDASREPPRVKQAAPGGGDRVEWEEF